MGVKLTYSETILLLGLDEQTGALHALPKLTMRYAIAGALLLELALANRIDTDLHHLHLIDARPTGDPLLDDILQRLGAADTELTTSVWLSALANQTPDLQEQVLQRLVDKDILRIEDRRILWVFTTQHYHLTDDRGVRGVRDRLRALIDSDEIPDPDEALLVALVDAFHLFDALFTAEQMARLRPRIKALARLDLIGREMAHTIRQISLAVMNQ
jgi:Golgi phosphoprotein 3